MKKLKYSCPFGGKTYPPILACIAAILCPVGALINGLPFSVSVALIAAAPLAVLTVCFLIEQRLTDAERVLIAESEMPLWQPAPPALIERARKTGYVPGACAVYGTFAAIGGALAFLSPASDASDLRIALMMVPFAAILWFIDFILRAGWKTADETTVYTVVPIHHMYDVEHHSEHHVTVESYLVFYLPDGRYTLHVPKGSGIANAVCIIKYGRLVTWTPYLPSEF